MSLQAYSTNVVVSLQSKLASMSKRFKSVLEVGESDVYLTRHSECSMQTRTKFMKEAKDRRSQYFDAASTFSSSSSVFLHLR